MSVMTPKRPRPAVRLAPPDPVFEAHMARVRFHLARARELRLRAERLEAERRLREERRPRGFFIGFI